MAVVFVLNLMSLEKYNTMLFFDVKFFTFFKTDYQSCSSIAFLHTFSM